jgi:hypothetical protein
MELSQVANVQIAFSHQITIDQIYIYLDYIIAFQVI